MDDITRLSESYRRARAELALLDANLWLGRPRSPGFAAGFDLPVLRRRLDRYDIRSGVVSHFASLTYGQVEGNRVVLDALEGTDLWAGIVLVPEMFEPEDAGREYLAAAIARGARAVRLFPRTHAFSLRPWCSGPMLRAIADSRIPVVLWHTEASWEEIRRLCESYPAQPVIVEGTPTKILYFNRQFGPLLAQCPNLRLEMHNLVAYLSVEDLVGRYGARHLIYGSYLPVYDPNATIMQIVGARIPDADKALMARENLAELIAGVRLT